MSGIEVAGVVLGAIPVILDLFNLLKEAFGQFRTYGKFAKVALRLDSKIEVQKTVFRNTCFNLLSIIDDRSKIQDLIRRPIDTVWSDKILNESFENHLESVNYTLKSCQKTMDQIVSMLESILKDTGNLQSLISRSSDVSRIIDLDMKSKRNIKYLPGFKHRK